MLANKLVNRLVNKLVNKLVNRLVNMLVNMLEETVDKQGMLELMIAHLADSFENFEKKNDLYQDKHAKFVYFVENLYTNLNYLIEQMHLHKNLDGLLEDMFIEPNDFLENILVVF